MSTLQTTLLTLLLLCHTPLRAELLPQGSQGFRFDLGFSTAPGLWKGTSFSDFAGQGKTQDIAAAYTSYFGVSKGLQIDLHIEFRHRKYTSGDPEVGGTVNAGDRFASIPNVGFRVNKQFIKKNSYELIGHWGLRAPGDDKRTGNFLDGTDGVTKYDVGFTITKSWTSLSSHLGFTYTHRPGEHDDQMSLNISLPYQISNWTVGPMSTLFVTLSGTDIGDADFTNSSQSTFRNFSLTKEDFVLLGLFAGTSLSSDVTLDFNIHHKIAGKNTDRATGLGLGVTHFY